MKSSLHEDKRLYTCNRPAMDFLCKDTHQMKTLVYSRGFTVYVKGSDLKKSSSLKFQYICDQIWENQYDEINTVDIIKINITNILDAQ
jgi:hypothetical protein